MFLEENENLEQQNNSNIDNDFKELDSEIDKVIHGEASYEEEQTEESNSDNNNSSKLTLNSTEFIDNEKENSNNTNQNLNNIKNKINQKNNKISKTNNLDEKKYINQFPQNYSSNLNKKPNIISSLNNLEKGKDIFNKINSNCVDNIYKNITQKTNHESFILNNNKLDDDYKNIINSILNINQINNYNNYLGISFQNFSQFNFYNSNGCINSNNNKNNSESYNMKVLNNINNINKLFNTNFEGKIKTNCIQNSYFSPIREQLMMNQKQEFLQNSQLNNFNQINKNIMNINFPPSKYNRLFFVNSQYQYQNQLILNQISNSNLNNYDNFNNNSKNMVNNPNYFLDNNNNMIFNIINRTENNNIILNRIKNKEEIKNSNYKKSMNFNPHYNNKNLKISKNDSHNIGIINYNPDKNYHKNKRKIFNPIPDSEKEKNIINLIDIIRNKDTRTTLMIKNIPNKYNISTFLDEINLYFKDTYDILYLPIDFINNCNLGFAFINFVEPLHIILFYELYRGKKWKKFNSEKICELSYAKFQGKKELISHFEKGQILSFDSEDKKPIILLISKCFL